MLKCRGTAACSLTVMMTVMTSIPTRGKELFNFLVLVTRYGAVLSADTHNVAKTEWSAVS